MTELNASGAAEPMSEERLAEIREREQAATTGPWSGYGSKPFEVFQEPGPSDEDSVYVTHGSDREADAEFIVAARQDIPDLLAEVERLRDAEKRVRDRHPRETDDADCPNADTTFGCQHGPDYHAVEFCSACDEEWPCAEIAALDGTEAGR